MESNDLTPEESFRIIGKAISNFKVNYKQSAKIFLLWGWILTLASFSNYLIVKILSGKEAYGQMGMLSFWIWVVATIIGFIILFIMQRKTNRDRKVYNYLESHMKNLWWVTVAGFFVAVFLCMKLEIVPPPFMLLIGGIATTTSGLLIKFKPFIFGGSAFFLFSIAATFVSLENISLIVCAAIICGYLIPGYMLKAAKA